MSRVCVCFSSLDEEKKNIDDEILTVHRNVNGSTNEPALATRSLRTKLEPPMTPLVTLPNEQPFSTPGCVCTVLCWYSFRHSRNAVAHCGHPVVFVLRILSGTPQQ